MRLFFSFINDQAIANDINPKIINTFSFVFKLSTLLKKIKNVITKEMINKGINFDVTKTNIDLYLFEVNKCLIPIYEFKDRIDDICRG